MSLISNWPVPFCLGSSWCEVNTHALCGFCTGGSHMGIPTLELGFMVLCFPHALLFCFTWSLYHFQVMAPEGNPGSARFPQWASECLSYQSRRVSWTVYKVPKGLYYHGYTWPVLTVSPFLPPPPYNVESVCSKCPPWSNIIWRWPKFSLLKKAFMKTANFLDYCSREKKGTACSLLPGNLSRHPGRDYRTVGSHHPKKLGSTLFWIVGCIRHGSDNCIVPFSGKSMCWCLVTRTCR